MPRSTKLCRIVLLILLGAAASARSADIPDTLEQRLVACAACHGKQGEGLVRSEIYPRLAGKPEGYLYNQLINFKQRVRRYAVMNYMVGYLSDAYLREIAQYYSNLRPPYAVPKSTASSEALARGEALVKRGDASRKLPACVECHGNALTGLAPAIPGLIGLSANYISEQMGAWRAQHRHAKAPDCMARIAETLSPTEITAVSAYLAAQPAPRNAIGPLDRAKKLPLECGSVTP